MAAVPPFVDCGLHAVPLVIRWATGGACGYEALAIFGRDLNVPFLRRLKTISRLCRDHPALILVVLVGLAIHLWRGERRFN